MQQAAYQQFVPSRNTSSARRCLACGIGLPPRRRRYCSVECRQNMLACLNRRTGLLRALNTRFATFYFTEFIIVVDLLPYGTEQIYSYILPRTAGRKPMEDFCELSNLLGTIWWNERERTKKRYLASRSVLAQAQKSHEALDAVKPSTLYVPSVKRSDLITLKLKAVDLKPANLKARIKRAYWQQAKKHHPDLGGNSRTFRKIQEAYELLTQWAKHPTFIRRSGFPDKWFYEGDSNRWVQPVVQVRAAK